MNASALLALLVAILLAIVGNDRGIAHAESTPAPEEPISVAQSNALSLYAAFQCLGRPVPDGVRLDLEPKSDTLGETANLLERAGISSVKLRKCSAEFLQNAGHIALLSRTGTEKGTLVLFVPGVSGAHVYIPPHRFFSVTPEELDNLRSGAALFPYVGEMPQALHEKVERTRVEVVIGGALIVLGLALARVGARWRRRRGVPGKIALLVALGGWSVLFAGAGTLMGCGTDPPPQIRFDYTRFDHGAVSDATPLRHRFNFINETRSPVRIVRVACGCGCFFPNPVFSKDAIQPGQRGFVEYDAKVPEPGRRDNSNVTVLFEAGGENVGIELQQTVNRLRGLRFNQSTVSFAARVPIEAPIEQRVVLSYDAVESPGLEFVRLETDNKSFAARLAIEEMESSGDSRSIPVYISMLPTTPVGSTSGVLTVRARTASDQQLTANLPLFADVNDCYKLTQSELFLSATDSAPLATGYVILRAVDTSDVKEPAVDTNSIPDGFQADLVARPGEVNSWKILVTWDSGAASRSQSFPLRIRRPCGTQDYTSIQVNALYLRSKT